MALSYLLALLVYVTLGLCAKLEQVTNFGDNPTKINMYIYVPDKLAAKPAIIVAVRNPLPLP
jgi:acetylxylan esterase